MELSKQQPQDSIRQAAGLFREIEKMLLEREQTELKCAELARLEGETFFEKEYVEVAFYFRMGASVLASIASSCEYEYRRIVCDCESCEPQIKPISKGESEQAKLKSEQALYKEQSRTEPVSEPSL